MTEFWIIIYMICGAFFLGCVLERCKEKSQELKFLGAVMIVIFWPMLVAASAGAVFYERHK